MVPYIWMNTELWKQATRDFENDLYKLMNNSVFGKTMENLRRWVNVKLVRSHEEDKLPNCQHVFRRGKHIWRWPGCSADAQEQAGLEPTHLCGDEHSRPLEDSYVRLLLQPDEGPVWGPHAAWNSSIQIPTAFSLRSNWRKSTATCRSTNASTIHLTTQKTTLCTARSTIRSWVKWRMSVLDA